MTRVRSRRAALVALLLALTALPATPVAATDPEAAAVAAGRSFLERYVDDGRVVRRDQGGDTVSEGQAYGLLVAVGLGDQQAFDEIWAWTATHLQRDDRLLAWRWADGRVTDWMPAADADLAAASALALAAARFSDGSYRAEADRLAAAVVARETATVHGRPTLLAGPWAVYSGTVNVSYFMVNAMSRLLWATGDRTWVELAATSRHLLGQQMAVPPHLPPDWSIADDAGSLTARAAPDGRTPRFAYDAARVLVQLAVDCQSAGRAIAARAWPFFASIAPDAIRAEYSLGGEALVEHRHPMTLVAAAGAADAAGAHHESDVLLDTATALDAQHPTYYGSAWIALGRLWLDTSRLGGCRA